MTQPQDNAVGELDSLVVQRAQVGDNDAFTTLFHFYSERIYGYLYGLIGNHEDAEDLTQQTFIKAWKYLPLLRDITCVKPWIFMIARNLAYDFGRNKKARKLAYDRGRSMVQTPLLSWEGLSHENIFAYDPGPEAMVVESEIVQLIFAQMPRNYRDCLLLQIEGRLSLREIAGLLEINEASAKTYVSTARKLFREAYQRITREINEDEIRRTIP